MDSFLSGYSNNLSMQNQQAVQRQTSGAQNAASASDGRRQQGVDITQLKEGDTFKGEITSINGEDVQILLSNGQYMAAKLEHDVQAAIGQVLNLQVKSNKDNKIVLKPVLDSSAQLQRVGAAALKAANLAVNEKNLQLVAKLIENGMSINKNTLMMFNKLALQHPDENLSNIIKLVKLQLPVTDTNLSQYENYQNLEHRLLEGIKDASEEIMKLYDALVNGESGVNNGAEASAAVGSLGQGIENAAKYMEQIISLLTEGGEDQGALNKGQPVIGVSAGNDTAESAQTAGREVTAEGQSVGGISAFETEAQPKANGGNALNAGTDKPTQLNAAEQGGLIKENTAQDNTAGNNVQAAAADSGKALNNGAVNNESPNVQTPDSAATSGKADSLPQGAQPYEGVNAAYAGNEGVLNKELPVGSMAAGDETAAGSKTAGNEVSNGSQPEVNAGNSLSTGADKSFLLNELAQDGLIKENAAQNKVSGNKAQATVADSGKVSNNVYGRALSNKIIDYMKEGRMDLKDIKNLLSDSSISKNFTAQVKNEIFNSEPFRQLIKNGLQRQWTIAPNELAEEGKLQEFYEKLERQSSRLSQLMNDAANAGGNETAAFHGRAAANIHENVEFMNQMNQLYSYVQLPLKLANSQAHGDLYVYTNKKNLARRDGMLTAFLHLDMENLGGIDVSIMLQTEKNEVLTKFYLAEDSLELLEEHIEELTQRLAKKGYSCKHMIQPRDEEKTVIEHIEEQAGGGAVSLSYQTFDMRT